jgi:hypothetical protein
MTIEGTIGYKLMLRYGKYNDRGWISASKK